MSHQIRFNELEPSQINAEVQKAWSETQSAIRTIGFDYAVYCYVSNKHHDAFQPMATESTLAWLQYHRDNQYAQHDPLVVIGQSKETKTWDCVSVDKRNRHAQKVMHDRKDYGMKSGITVPMVNKFGKLTAWLSLALEGDVHELANITKAPQFEKEILDIHIKTAAKTLCNLAQVDYFICYAIVLASYLEDIAFIAEKTHLSQDQIINLFGYLFLKNNDVDFFSLDISPQTVEMIKNCVRFLYGK